MPPRALWKGSLSFGLVNIPVRLYPAIKDKAISFTMLCGDCHTPLKYRRWCSRCEREVEWDKIDRGYPITKEKFVILTKPELERLELKTVKTIDIQRFVDGAAIDSLYFSSHYHLVPDEGGEKAYSLLKDALALTNKVAIGQVVIHNKEHLVAIWSYKESLVMSTMHYADELVDPARLEELRALVKIGDKERELAKVLIEHLSGDFEPEKYVDRYRHAVMELVRQKAEGAVLPAAKPVEVEATVDLMKALEASVKTLVKEVEAAKKKPAPA